VEGEPTKTFPHHVAVRSRWRAGTRIIVDQNPALTMPSGTCAGLSPNMGCIAQYEATPDLDHQLKKGQMLTIRRSISTSR